MRAGMACSFLCHQEAPLRCVKSTYRRPLSAWGDRAVQTALGVEATQAAQPPSGSRYLPLMREGEEAALMKA